MGLRGAFIEEEETGPQGKKGLVILLVLLLFVLTAGAGYLVVKLISPPDATTSTDDITPVSMDATGHNDNVIVGPPQPKPPKWRAISKRALIVSLCSLTLLTVLIAASLIIFKPILFPPATDYNINPAVVELQPPVVDIEAPPENIEPPVTDTISPPKIPGHDEQQVVTEPQPQSAGQVFRFLFYRLLFPLVLVAFLSHFASYLPGLASTGVGILILLTFLPVLGIFLLFAVAFTFFAFKYTPDPLSSFFLKLNRVLGLLGLRIVMRVVQWIGTRLSTGKEPNFVSVAIYKKLDSMKIVGMEQWTTTVDKFLGSIDVTNVEMLKGTVETAVDEAAKHKDALHGAVKTVTATVQAATTLTKMSADTDDGDDKTKTTMDKPTGWMGTLAGFIKLS